MWRTSLNILCNALLPLSLFFVHPLQIELEENKKMMRRKATQVEMFGDFIRHFYLYKVGF